MLYINLIFFFSEKPFSFLNPDEIEKMKLEEEKKIASLSRKELEEWSSSKDKYSDDLGINNIELRGVEGTSLLDR